MVRIKLRLDFLNENRGEIGKEKTDAIITQLKDYFPKQLNSNFFAFIAEYSGQAVSTVFMTVAENPANPDCITGKTAKILNVFTYPDFRRKGIATNLLKMVISEAKTMNISYLELSATDSGKPVYEKLGFILKQPINPEMRLNHI